MVYAKLKNMVAAWCLGYTKREKVDMKPIISRVLLVLLGLTLGTLGAYSLSLGKTDSSPFTMGIQAPPQEGLLEDEKNTISIYNRAATSVVFITNQGTRVSTFPFQEQREVRQGAGSGFVWDREGHIITNFHVIRGATKLFVKMIDGSNFPATVVGSEPDKDLVVLRIEAPAQKLRPIQMGTSRNLQVGQKVLAIGNPFGYDVTLTTGVVSALDRQIKATTDKTIENVIQTDAAINPGNSGGPLLDSHGRVIGINTAIVSPSGSYAGIGFAVPADTINRVVPQIIKHGKVKTPGLGVRITRRPGVSGLVIVDVLPGSSADKARLIGIQQDEYGRTYYGDVIVSIQGKLVETTEDIYSALDKHKVGDRVEIGYKRGRTGRLRKVMVTLQSIHRK